MSNFREELDNHTTPLLDAISDQLALIKTMQLYLSNFGEGLESDLDIERDANKALHIKLEEVSGKRDEYRSMVVELVAAAEYVLREYKDDSHELYPHIKFELQTEVMASRAAITKAKELTQ